MYHIYYMYTLYVYTICIHHIHPICIYTIPYITMYTICSMYIHYKYTLYILCVLYTLHTHSDSNIPTFIHTHYSYSYDVLAAVMTEVNATLTERFAAFVEGGADTNAAGTTTTHSNYYYYYYY